MSSPFKFLEAYGAADEDQFFGREKETAQLYNAVYASNLTLLYGASGTGKTSLVSCGLRNKFYSTEWLPIFINRGENINESVQQALKKEIDLLEATDSLDSETILEQLDRLYLAHYKPIYLIFDQFEELYVLGNRKEALPFYETIKRIVKSGLPAKIILIIREEWIGSLNLFEKIMPTLFDNRLRIERMTDRTIARVIFNTLRYHKIELKEPEPTIYRILNNLRDKEGIALTNLQVYLDKLYQKDLKRQAKEANPIITFDPSLVAEVGAMKNVLADFLDEQLLQLEERLITERGFKNARGIPLEILFALVSDENTKRSLAYEEIRNYLPKSVKITEEDIRFCLKEFERIRILKQE